MIATVRSGTVWGIEAYAIEAEVEVGRGLPAWHVVGLPAAAVKEGRVRIKAALEQSGLMPAAKGRTTVNLAPADVRKEGSAFDLAIATAFLIAHEVVPAERIAGWLVVGELALDGSVRPARGVLPIAAHARKLGAPGVIVPRANGPEAALVEGLDARVVGHVSELVAHLRGERELAVATRADPAPCNDGELDFADVRGQLAAKRAIEVAAAGGHNLLLIGPPGAGKTMLAQRIPTILPPLDLDRALETTAIYSVAALLGDFALMRRPPFRAPHHTVSDAGLLGGGTPPRPGEVSLANNGVLFLDEVPEFRRSALEALRQPLEDRRIHIARARQTVIYPARVTLVGAMNPCPCGHYGDTARACVCGPSQVARYRSRLSGPLLDRIDMHVQVGTVSYAALAVDDGPDHASAAIAGRVAEARERQRRRLAGSGLAVNAEMRGRLMRRTCALSDDAERLLTMAVARLGLSARSVDRVLKVARTVADLGGSDRIERRHLGEAVGYRALDRAPVAVGSASGYAASNA